MPLNSNVTQLRVNRSKKPTIIKNILQLVSTNMLVTIVILAILSSLVSYTLVLYKENYLIKLHKQTVVTQMENVNIKTKVEFAKSLYNVEGKAETLSYLHKPEKVIEIEPGYKKFDLTLIEKPKLAVEKVVVGY